jgi:hypothetical protein
VRRAVDIKQVSLRYDAAKIEPRVTQLLPHVQADHDGITISPSRVLLFALLEGLEALERRYGIKS